MTDDVTNRDAAGATMRDDDFCPICGAKAGRRALARMTHRCEMSGIPDIPDDPDPGDDERLAAGFAAYRDDDEPEDDLSDDALLSDGFQEFPIRRRR